MCIHFVIIKFATFLLQYYSCLELIKRIKLYDNSCVRTPAEWTSLTTPLRSLTVPSVSGYWTSRPLMSFMLLKSVLPTSHMITSQPSTLHTTMPIHYNSHNSYQLAIQLAQSVLWSIEQGKEKRDVMRQWKYHFPSLVGPSHLAFPSLL